jgi:hypothetical protein
MVPRSLRSGPQTARASGHKECSGHREEEPKTQAHTPCLGHPAERNLGGGEELVVAGGGEREIAETFGVDGDYVGVPEGDVGEIFGG